MNRPIREKRARPARVPPDHAAPPQEGGPRKPPPLNQSLDRGLRILEAYSSDRQSFGIRELGRMLDVNAATIYRLVATLARFGYLEQDVATQKYHLGAKVMSLSAAYTAQNSMIDIAYRVFAKYENKFKYNFYLGVMQDDDAVYVAVKEARSRIKVAVEPGERLSLPSSALGKVLLASKDDAFIKELFARAPLRPLTPLTITSARELMRQIREIRRTGYSVNRGEIYSELAAVAAPVQGPDGEIAAALSLTFPLHELDSKTLRLDDVVRLTREAAEEVSLLSRSQSGRSA